MDRQSRPFIGGWCPLYAKKLVERDWKFAQLAAVVAGVDGQDAVPSSRAVGGPHGASHRRLVHAVDRNFVGHSTRTIARKEWLIAVDRLRLKEPACTASAESALLKSTATAAHSAGKCLGRRQTAVGK
jgi:hypothetical protein